MPRITRAMAAQAVDEVQMHVDRDEKEAEHQSLIDSQTENGGVSILGKHDEENVLNVVTPDAKTERMPLGEIAPNSAEGKKVRVVEVKRTTGKRGGRKGGKGGNQSKDEEDEDEGAASEDLEVDLSKEDDGLTPAPQEESTGSEVESVSLTVQDAAIDSLASQAGELSKSRLSSPTTEVSSTVQPATVDYQAEGDVPSIWEPQAEPTALDAPASPLPSAVPRVVESLRKTTPAKRSTSNKENVQPIDYQAGEALEDSQIDNSTMPSETLPALPPSIEQPMLGVTASPARKGESRPEDHIKALDDLNEAVESFNDKLPQAIDSPKKKSVTVKDDASALNRKSNIVGSPVKARSTPTSSSKTANPSAEKLAMRVRPSSVRQSTTLGRTSSVKRAAEAKPLNNKRPLPASREPATSKPKPSERKETIIPHSKPRPVPISFPTPPPPPKSTKAPTRSTFTLPGEAIAAKLKAAREERMKKETEEKEKKPAFKARPAPASTLKRTPSVRQTASSAARLSIASGKPTATSSRDSIAGHRRTQSAAITSGTAPKRLSSIPDTKPTGKPSPSDGPVRVAKRHSTLASNSPVDRLSKPRISSLNPPSSTAPKPKPTTVPKAPILGHQRAASLGVVSNTTGTVKGKEVFKRAANAKAAAEKEKREKEDASKNARAAAAERGRQASRDWAEKQKMKKLGLRPATDAIKSVIDPSEGERQGSGTGEQDTTASAQVDETVGGDAAAQAAAA
ncbi:hypothetical protein K431DRAFT_286609 [Polychaeton citri CBS 116435]|uniref:Uncharacterized protein n=1 Tax=Polychaeton citri CBS 116435 TaxID=1314669 RepID=A0A9P4Q6Z4_9PEZI|nr:hypothetical protein K431DRAFT_286609 [Polychaeton citri CBS 116435]